MDGAGTRNLYSSLLHHQKSGFFLVLLLSALINILTLTGSVFMLQVYDRVIPTGSITTLFGLFTIAVTLYGFYAVFDVLRQRILSRISLRVNLDLGEECFRTWIRSGPRKPPNDSEPLVHLGVITKFLSGPLAISIFDLPFVPLFLMILLIIHPWLGGVVIAAILVSALASLTVTRISRPWYSTARQQQQILQEFSDRSRNAADALAATQMQRHLSKRWKAMQDKFLAYSQKTNLPSELLSTANKTLRALLQTVLLTVGAVLVIWDQITPGMIMAVLILSGRVLTPIDHLITRWREVGNAFTSHRKMSSFHNAGNTDFKEGPVPKPKGHITVRSITVFPAQGVRGLHKPPLQDVSFDIPLGTRLGIFGHSSAGKSLLAKIMLGASRPDIGEIFIDGIPLHDWPSESLERTIGYLPQNVALLPATVSDNIARFDMSATADDVIAAAKLAGAHKMISSLPHGYSTQVGERNGIPLSCGQIQLIGLARSFLFLPALVILDEPYTHLDASGIVAFDKAIIDLKQENRTAIIMSHNPETLKLLDKILTLENGCLKDFEHHDQAKSREYPSRINVLPRSIVQNQPVTVVQPNVATFQRNLLKQ